MRVLLFLLKCLVGLFASVGFLLVAGAIAVGLFVDREDLRWAAVGEKLPERSVLLLDIGDGLVEARPQGLLARASLGRTLVLQDLLAALEAARHDPRVAGLLVDVGRGNLGLAQVQELRDAVAAFRVDGKFTMAFAESFGEAGDGTSLYYLASGLGEVWLQPSGDLDLTGFQLESPFLRDALDKIGVLPRIDQREEYKGIANTLTASALPAPQRANLQRLVDSWLDQVTRGIAGDRGLDAAAVRRLVDLGPYLAEAALAEKLVDRLGYWDQLVESALDAAGEDAEIVEIADYDRQRRHEKQSGPVIALIYGQGEIALGDGESDPLTGRLTMGSDTLADAFSEATEDEEIEAIVFRIDSPGGSYVASDTIWREVARAHEAGKPVIVSMGNVAASGGYFVAAPADRIVAQPGTLTGSIGVAGGKMVAAELWAKLGVNWDGVTAGANADIWSMNRDFSAAGWQRLQEGLDRTYADFLDKVTRGRALPAERVRSAAKGQVWTGEDAHKLGLVDELGGLSTAIVLARRAIGVADGDPAELRVLPEPSDGFGSFLESALAERIGTAPLALLQGLARAGRLLAPAVELIEGLSADPRARSLRAGPVIHR